MKKTLLFSFCLVAVFVSATFTTCSSSRYLKKTDEEGYHFVFDGKSLDGWKYDPVYWRIENGTLVGEVTPATILKRNSFIINQNLITRNFELKVEFRVSEHGNSGINYRSEEIDSMLYAMRGYQCDIDGENLYTGQNYEERGRTTLAYAGQQVLLNTPGDRSSFKDNIKNNAWTKAIVTGSLGTRDSLKQFIRKGDWNECHLVVNGNHLKHYINDALMSEVTDNDTINRKLTGHLGVQVHVGPPMKIEYRNFRIKEL